MKITHWAITGLPRRRWWHRLLVWRRLRRGRVWLRLSEPVELPDTSTPRTIRREDLDAR